MTYLDNIQKPIYRIEEERRIIHFGSVVIEGIEHRVEKGWVWCNLSLQGKSFNTTPKKGICQKCFPGVIFKKKIENIQLTLF